MTRARCNERLEFLGDAVLEIVSSEYLFRLHPDLPEGELTKLRASMVCEPTLALCAADIGLGQLLLLGKGEEATGGRERPSVTSDAVEALIGAVYLDGGFDAARDAVHRLVLDGIEEKRLYQDSKSLLQEAVQRDRRGEELTYVLLSQEGPDHCTRFTVEARVSGEPWGRGTGASKKQAEQNAAYEALKKLRRQTNGPV